MKATDTIWTNLSLTSRLLQFNKNIQRYPCLYVVYLMANSIESAEGGFVLSRLKQESKCNALPPPRRGGQGIVMYLAQ